jgi:hypothetical protein
MEDSVQDGGWQAACHQDRVSGNLLIPWMMMSLMWAHVRVCVFVHVHLSHVYVFTCGFGVCAGGKTMSWMNWGQR